jgi:hypothetical protein
MGEEVVFTLTDYNQHPADDRNFVKLLQASYSRVHFWPQGTGDKEYLDTLNIEGVIVLPSSLASYDDLLAKSDSIDYVGTRLHAGIRALQYKRRAVVLAVDNRATEINKDIGLPVVDRSRLDLLGAEMKARWPTVLRIDFGAVSQWKAQFQR